MINGKRATNRNLIRSEESVVEYLEQHPKFFADHTALFTTMEMHFPNDKKVLSLEQELSALREENRQLQRKLDNLIRVATENEQLNQRVKRLVADLTNVVGLDDFFHTLYSNLCNEFHTDTVVVRYFKSLGVKKVRQEFVEYDAQVFTIFDSLLKSCEPICGGKISTEQIEYLFPDSQIASAVLIPLGIPESQGLLAMGSHDASRFHTDMRTDFLKYLGELVNNLLTIWLHGLGKI
jgi:uncharacterized protein YigA (DUF484 family)